ncbi:MAG: 6-aminohexanoate hydrolase [Ahrensia sp.]|nr:6-aminohexanoate hydrolase [Ahrensia sp.]|tara:strand:+ start:55159 stop:56541 length:1383 start_codon:yes stop_codon:yes gene_type:complete
MRIVKGVVALLAAVIIGFAGWLYFAPPDLIRVGSHYSAKIVCSNVFLAGRDSQATLETDVQAPGHWLLRLMDVSVDRTAGEVRAGLLGIFGGGLSVYREGQGCAAVPDGDIEAVRARPAPPLSEIAAPGEGVWPEGETVEPLEDSELYAVLNDEALVGPGMRAVVVVRDGRIVGERYGEGFDENTRLLGWSMTKSVTAALIGRLVREDRISVGETDLFENWTDGRSRISIANMLGMASDLTWNEEYGDVSDVTRMLYLEPDMAGFAASMPLDTETPGGIGEVFEYSSGTTVMLSRIWENVFVSQAEALAFPNDALFGPLGMSSAVLETDARGTFVGSSYLYATARDWARMGLFLLQRGVWNGRSLLPVGFVDWMVQPHPASNGEYGRGQVWRRAPNAWLPGDNPDLPEDAFFMSGHDGQSVSIVPSEGLVVVRLGLTPTAMNYKPAFLVQALIDTLDRAD